MSKPLIASLDEEDRENTLVAEAYRSYFKDAEDYSQKPPSLNKHFEHLEHTADIQIHGWGASIFDAMSACVSGLFSYMTDLELVSVKDMRLVYCHCASSAELVYRLLSETLYLFHESFFLVKYIEFRETTDDKYSLVAAWYAILFNNTSYGEPFDPKMHAQGTEIKAITLSNLRVDETADRTDIFVIVDI